MAIDKSDPWDGLPRRGMFAAKATVISRKPVVISQLKPAVPELREVISQPARKKRGEVRGKAFLVRLQPALESRVVTWATANEADSIPEAIRRLIEKALSD